MKALRYTLVIIIAVVFCSCVSKNINDNEGHYVERRGGFSILIPDAWQAIEVQDFQYKMLRGAFTNNFAPTINFVDEPFNRQFDEYVIYVTEELQKLFGDNIEFIVLSDFITTKGLDGKIIVITTYQQEKLIQLSFFLFPGDNRNRRNRGNNIIITCTSLADEHEKYSALFIRTVRTFEWIR